MIQHLYKNMMHPSIQQYDFRGCVNHWKISVTVHSLHIVAILVLGILFIVSVGICLKRTCSRWRRCM